MGIFSLGMALVSGFGGSLILIALLEKAGLSINEDMLRLVMEVVKFGSIFWLLNELSKLFF
ncbi:hypothetical protein [Bacillus sp. 2205SS5-2]|uniref:hypothetical protein n=1 Tax=Bacillus sp. 2205SS5-2 TaxID=3109031 RepID=UPI003007976B